jgi:arylsulfatase B
LWEGGVKGVSFVSGGFVPIAMRGTQNNDPVHIADWYSTFAALAGADPTDAAAAKAGLPAVDGVNLWPRLSGSSRIPARHEIYGDGLYESYGFLVNGTYKVILGHGPGSATAFAVWTGPKNPNSTYRNSSSEGNPMAWNCSSCTPPVVLGTVNCSLGCLYNVVEDPGERVELSNAEPALKAALLARLLFLINTTAFAPNRGVVDPRACQVGVAKYKGVWGPFAFL